MATAKAIALSSVALPLLLLLTTMWGASSQDSLKGEWGQDVLACRCNGRKGTHGYCGYHMHWGSQEDKPWCRTMFSCGISGLKGTWAHCDERGVEQRRADDGKLYNSKKFKEFYGDKGKDKWFAAEPYTEKRMAKNGKPYTVFEFRDYYVDSVGEQGWVDIWVAAEPEQRQAHDGIWYTFDEFWQHYSKEKVWATWDSAKKRDEL